MNASLLGEIVDVRGGGTPARSTSQYWGGDIPWATVKDLKSTKISQTEEYLTPEGVQNSATNIIPAGSIIVPTRMALGKVAINEADIAINQDLKALLIKDESLVDRDYLMRFLQSRASFIESQGKGATVKGITLDVLKGIEVPLPKKVEQQRIAAILDKADAIRRKRQQAIDLADDFLRSIFLEMFGDPKVNPKGWNTVTLEEAIDPATSITYGIVQAGPHVDGGVKYIRTGDFKNGRLAEEGYARTSADIAARYERSTVREGELVYCIRASIGAVDIVPAHLDGANLTQGTARIAPGPHMRAGFLVEQLRTKGFFAYVDRESKGATFKEITLTRLREAPVVMPPVELQDKFVESRQAILNLVDKLAMSNRVPLFESLAQRAFAGEL